MIPVLLPVLLGFLFSYRYILIWVVQINPIHCPCSRVEYLLHLWQWSLLPSPSFPFPCSTKRLSELFLRAKFPLHSTQTQYLSAFFRVAKHPLVHSSQRILPRIWSEFRFYIHCFFTLSHLLSNDLNALFKTNHYRWGWISKMTYLW
jgi:hypothetical protein